MPLKECLQAAGALVGDRLKELLDRKAELIKGGMDEVSADRKVKDDFIAEAHQGLHNDLNNIRASLKLPQQKYSPLAAPDLSAIHAEHDQSIAAIDKQISDHQRPPEQVISDAASAGQLPGMVGEMIKKGAITPEQGLVELAKQQHGVADDGSDVGTARALTGYNSDVTDAINKRFPDKQSLIDHINTTENERQKEGQKDVLTNPVEPVIKGGAGDQAAPLPNSTLQAVEAIKSDRPLTDTEKTIVAENAPEIFKELTKDNPPVPLDSAEILIPDATEQEKLSFADRLLQWADKIEKFDLTGSGGGAAMLDLIKVPQAFLAASIRLVAHGLKAGKTVADAIKDGAEWLAKQGHPDVDKDKEFTRIALDVSVGREPRFNTPEMAEIAAKDPVAEIPVTKKTPGGGLAKFRNWTVANFNNLGKADMESKNAALKMGSTMAQVNTMLRIAAPKIIKLLGNEGWHDLANAIVQSRLDGIRGRWADIGNTVRTMPDADVLKTWTDSLSRLVEIYDRHYPELNAKGNLESLLAMGDNQSFKTLAQLYFADAANNVQNVDFGEGKSYESVTSHPNFQDALKVYKEHIEQPIADIHDERGGVFSDALGDLKTYYPLVPLVKEGHVFMRKAKEYGTSMYTGNFFASGLSPKGYDTNVEKFTGKLYSYIKSSNRDGLMRTLEEAGLVKITNKLPEDPKNVGLNVNGEFMKAKVLNVAEGRETVTRAKDGSLKSSVIPPRYAIVPEWMHKELTPLFESKEFDKNSASKILDGVTSFALGSPFEFTIHFSNLMGTMVSGTPLANTTLLGKIASRNFIPKFLYSMTTIWSEPIPEADLRQMADEGLMSNRYASVTTKKAIAESTNAEHVKWYSPKIFSVLLFGAKGVDVKARHRLWRLHQDMFPDTSADLVAAKQKEIDAQTERLETFKVMNQRPGEEVAKLKSLNAELVNLNKDQASRINDRREFVNQLGNYVWAAQGNIERFLKKSGLTPFYTAGSTMFRNGLNAWLGTQPLSAQGWQKNLGYRIGQQLSSGIVGLAGTWAAMYYLTTGKMPWKDKDSRFMELPVPDWAKKTDVGKALFHHADGSWSGISLGFANPAMMRGGRSLGFRGAYNTMQAGGTPGQAVEHGEVDVLNSLISPIATSPFVNFGATAISGHAPALHAMRDVYGDPSPQFIRTVAKYKPGEQQLANVGQAVLNLNPLLSRIGEASGYSFAPKYKSTENDTKTQRVLSAVVQMMFPRLLTFGHNTGREERQLIREEKASEKNHR